MGKTQIYVSNSDKDGFLIKAYLKQNSIKFRATRVNPVTSINDVVEWFYSLKTKEDPRTKAKTYIDNPAITKCVGLDINSDVIDEMMEWTVSSFFPIISVGQDERLFTSSGISNLHKNHLLRPFGPFSFELVVGDEYDSKLGILCTNDSTNARMIMDVTEYGVLPSWFDEKHNPHDTNIIMQYIQSQSSKLYDLRFYRDSVIQNYRDCTISIADIIDNR